MNKNVHQPEHCGLQALCHLPCCRQSDTQGGTAAGIITIELVNVPELLKLLLLIGCAGEVFEPQHCVRQVVDPKAVCPGVEGCPLSLCCLHHAPVCVSLQRTYYSRGQVLCSKQVAGSGKDGDTMKVGNSK